MRGRAEWTLFFRMLGVRRVTRRVVLGCTWRRWRGCGSGCCGRWRWWLLLLLIRHAARRCRRWRLTSPRSSVLWDDGVHVRPLRRRRCLATTNAGNPHIFATAGVRVLWMHVRRTTVALSAQGRQVTTCTASILLTRKHILPGMNTLSTKPITYHLLLEVGASTPVRHPHVRSSCRICLTRPDQVLLPVHTMSTCFNVSPLARPILIILTWLYGAPFSGCEPGLGWYWFGLLTSRGGGALPALFKRVNNQTMMLSLPLSSFRSLTLEPSTCATVPDAA